MIGRKTGAAQALGVLVSVLAAKKLASSKDPSYYRLEGLPPGEVYEPPDPMWSTDDLPSEGEELP